MIRRPPRATRTDTLCPTRRSSDLGPCDAGRERESVRGLVIDQLSDATTLEISLAGAVDSGARVRGEGERPTGGRRNKEDGRWPQPPRPPDRPTPSPPPPCAAPPRCPDPTPQRSPPRRPPAPTPPSSSEDP